MFDKTLTIEKVKSNYDNNKFGLIVLKSSNNFFMDFILATIMSVMQHLKFRSMKTISLLLVGKLLEKFPNG